MSDGETERAAKNEALRLSIVNWIPSEIARQPAKLKEFEDALAADVAKHSISFTRFGDFVSVMQDRNGVKSMKAIQLIREYNKDEKGNNTTLKPASITFGAGKAPTLDNGGYAGKQHSWSSDGDKEVFYSTPDFGGQYEANQAYGMCKLDVCHEFGGIMPLGDSCAIGSEHLQMPLKSGAMSSGRQSQLRLLFVTTLAAISLATA